MVQLNTEKRGGPPPTRVVVVDNDVTSRRSLGELLAGDPEVELLGLLSHDDALTWRGDWGGTDVVVLDVAGARRSDDRAGGASVMEHLWRVSTNRDLVIIVMTGNFFDDAVRRRMREANADDFYRRARFRRSFSFLRRGHPIRHRAATRAPEVLRHLFRLGIVVSPRADDAGGSDPCGSKAPPGRQALH